ncbi:hypothetical protein V8C37DRAFT_373925 [Trichoderma ceciliae]
MSKRAPLAKLSISDEKSNHAETDIAMPQKWDENDVPSRFGAETEKVSPNKYTKKVAAATSTKKDEPGNPAITRKADLESNSDEAYWARQEAMILENIYEAELVDDDIPMIEEQSPRMEDEEVSFSAADFGAGAAESGTTLKRASEELGYSLENDSDLESEDDLQVNPVCTSQSMIVDTTRVAASDIANMVKSTTKSHAELNRSPEANIQQSCQKCALMEEELKSRDKLIAALEAQMATSANKTMSSVDAGTNTETPPGQNWQLSYLRECDIERQFSTTKQSTLLLQVPFILIQACLNMAKIFYLLLTYLLGIVSQKGRELFLFCVSGSVSLKGKTHSFKNIVEPAIIYLATPVCLTANLALFMSMHREKDKWTQANGLTRKHLLKHAGGESVMGEFIFAIASLAITNGITHIINV